MTTVLCRWRYPIALVAILAAITPEAVIDGKGTNPEGAQFQARTTAYVGRSSVKLPPPETPAVMRAEANLARHRLSPEPGNQYFDGWGVNAAAGKTFNVAGVNLLVPTVDCSNVIVGTSGTAYITGWVGLEPIATGGDLEQTGFYGWCTGPAGKRATAGPFFSAWYYIYPHTVVTNYAGQPALHPDDLLGFEVAWNASTHRFDFTFADHTTGQTFHASLACPSGDNCSIRNNAGVVTESPGGGPPAYPMPYWPYADCGNCFNAPVSLDYSGAFVRTSDGAQGSLGGKTGEWTTTGPFTMAFPTEPKPYAIGGYYNTTTNLFSQGYPTPLMAGGTAFTTGCVQVVDNNPQDDLFC